MKKPRWVIWIAVCLGWMVIGLSFSLNDYAFRGMLARYFENSPSLPSMLLWDLIYWPMWAALTPLILLIARRFPVRRNSLYPNLLIGVAAWLLLPVLQRLIYLVIAWPLQNVFGERTPFLDLLLYNLPLGLMISGVILLVSHLIHYYQEEELRASRLKAELAEEESQLSQLKAQLAHAQLQALKMQLHPHFLFNALSSISSLLSEDVKAADKMLEQLSVFLRLTLENSGSQSVPLEKELAFLRCYLEIEQVRLEDRLQVHYEIAPETLAAEVPNLILQPIIENSIKHGVGQSFGPVRIVVAASRKNGKLHLEIRDTGEAQDQNAGDYHEGFGIGNTRSRLQTTYGELASFELRDRDGWTIATLQLPFVTSREDLEVSVS